MQFEAGLFSMALLLSSTPQMAFIGHFWFVLDFCCLYPPVPLPSFVQPLLAIAIAEPSVIDYSNTTILLVSSPRTIAIDRSKEFKFLPGQIPQINNFVFFISRCQCLSVFCIDHLQTLLVIQFQPESL